MDEFTWSMNSKKDLCTVVLGSSTCYLATKDPSVHRKTEPLLWLEVAQCPLSMVDLFKMALIHYQEGSNVRSFNAK